ncbi:uncharacterized protein MONOS_13108 [Monocercomonoides exilis]|uniref:uncharacterized protein n=1 Tax=Monocercomonoides exilis TaxID=2049356 RepID=UPI003559532C|nr:hypothetical protein MONOS_13108 [Monocercomonoides exilis]|eukprot:MONOS_13108.1-p1 / transcript=MONOS_13108.1 / gene=MONOS_13108 / organism=Monocercomonoides_exilis_PA203 / gene_product=unspecified product / transcript_product=unspecified product / location=Mono_scaffold00779:8765-10240(-) / protein_length=302 / sequence_SO=supercontig / SO=protein_coding / is_pseudo=false
MEEPKEKESGNVEQKSSKIETLREQIKEKTAMVDQLADESRYEEAERHNRELMKMEKQLLELEKIELAQQHKAEIEELGHRFEVMKASLEQEWSEKISQFEKESQEQLDTMKELHANQIKEVEEQFEARECPPFKESMELVTLRATEKDFARMRRFQEAQRAKLAADSMLQVERDRYERDLQSRKKRRLDALREEQKKELNGLIKRIERQRKDETMRKTDEEAILDKRYHEQLKQRRSQQKQEMIQKSNQALLSAPNYSSPRLSSSGYGYSSSSSPSSPSSSNSFLSSSMKRRSAVSSTYS